MNYIIKFDNREKELIKRLTDDGFILETENLDLGDILFIDATTKDIIIIIERKTMSDLSASIKDGRYKEQKERLIHSIGHRVRKIMLIEGNDFENFSLSEKTYNSVIINTIIRDDIHIHHTNNIDGTIDFILNIMANLPKYYEEIKEEIVNGVISKDGSEHNIYKVKKDNLTPQICFRNMLCQINGISNNIANVYVKKYENMKNFINILGTNDNNTLLEILANEKNENNRRIGEKLAEKILIYIFGIDQETIDSGKKIKKSKVIKEKTVKEKTVKEKTVKEKVHKNININNIVINDNINLTKKSLFQD
jgi:crossover junction endonuclease MUS81